jgi:hypothetical protein
VKAIVAHLVTHPQKKQDHTGDANSKTKDIDQGKNLVAIEVPQGA